MITSSTTTLRIFYLCLKRIKDSTYHRCKLLAADLDEALRTARMNYGPVQIVAIGTRDLALGTLCFGAGRFIPTRYDRLIPQATLEELQQVS